jgi:hypothetical protein
MAELNESNISSGRDDRGQFLSKSAIQDAAIKALSGYRQQTSEAEKQLSRLRKEHATTQKQAAKTWAQMSRGMKTYASGISNEQKALDRMTRTVLKQQKAYQRLARMKIGQATGKGGLLGGIFGGGSGDGGSGWKMPAGVTAVIGGLISIEGIKRLGEAVTELARARDYAQALGGSFRDVNQQLPTRRDAELYSKYAEQRFSNRYAAPEELEGLQRLRAELDRSLGPEAGEKLTLGLTDSLKSSQEQLSRFLAMASQNVPQALAAFEGADVERFATALAAVNQQQNEMSKTAATIEKCYRDIKAAGEEFLTGIVNKYGGDARTMMVDISNSVIDTVNYFGDLIDRVDQFGQGLKRAKEWFWGPEGKGPIGKDDSMTWWQRTLVNMGVAEVVPDKPTAATQPAGLPARMPKIPHISLPSPQPAVSATSGAIQAAITKTKEWYASLSKLITPIEAAHVSIGKIDDQLTVTNAQVKASQSRLSAMESSPFGFAGAYEQTLKTANDLNSRIQELTEKYRQQVAVVQETRRLGGDVNKARIDALNTESEINDTIAERNRLLQGQAKGYLDAITAQAFGAGKFSKIIVDQDRNLGMALGNLVKANPLLGNTGAPSNVMPFQFGTDVGKNFAGAQRYQDQLSAHFQRQGFSVAPMPSLPTILQGITGGDALSSLPRPSAPAGKGSSPAAVTPTTPGASILISAGELLIQAGERLLKPQAVAPAGGRVRVPNIG